MAAHYLKEGKGIMADRQAPQRTLYANYWENDTTANPMIVRLDRQVGEFFDITLPANKGKRQVHLHTLGRPHVAL